MTRTTIAKTALCLALTVAAAALSPTLAVTEAAAQNRACGARDNLVAALEARFGEQRSSLMLDTRGNLLEMFRNAETGSWTLTLTVPGGPTCIINAGEYFVEEARTRTPEDFSS